MICLDANNTGGNNTAVGQGSLGANTTGAGNTAVGRNVLSANTTAGNNVVVGFNSAYSNTTGTSLTGIGAGALSLNTTGSKNTGIGTNANMTQTTGSNTTCLGFNAYASSSTVSNEITLGDGNISSLRCADTSISSLSDRRDKTDIIDLPVGLDFINSLLPRQFKWQTREGSTKDGTVRAGFIAQELQEAQKGSEYLDLVMEENPEKLEAKQGKLIPVLVKAIQELSAKVTALEAA